MITIVKLESLTNLGIIEGPLWGLSKGASCGFLWQGQLVTLNARQGLVGSCLVLRVTSTCSYPAIPELHRNCYTLSRRTSCCIPLWSHLFYGFHDYLAYSMPGPSSVPGKLMAIQISISVLPKRTLFRKTFWQFQNRTFLGCPGEIQLQNMQKLKCKKKRKNVKHGRNTCAHLVYKSRKRYKYVGSESVGRMSSHILVQTSYTQYWIRSRDDRNCAKIGLQFRTFV